MGDADQSLCLEQVETRREFALDLGRGKRLVLDQRFEMADQVSGGFESRRRIRENHAVADHSVIGGRVGQHQRRLRDDAAGGAMRGLHRHADGAHAQRFHFGRVRHRSNPSGSA
jgi:hypothetical protein